MQFRVVAIWVKMIEQRKLQGQTLHSKERWSEALSGPFEHLTRFDYVRVAMWGMGWALRLQFKSLNLSHPSLSDLRQVISPESDSTLP